jgi:hypothetical protein
MQDVRQNACHNADRANRENVISSWGGLLMLRSGGSGRSLRHQFSIQNAPEILLQPSDIHSAYHSECGDQRLQEKH